MSIERILSDWSDYDNKKKLRQDANFFACTEQWEVDYLVGKIISVYPQVSQNKITAAIRTCCIALTAPHPRRKFVQCVIERLGI